MARNKDRITPSTYVGTASEFASRSARTAMGNTMPSAISVTPIIDKVPAAPHPKSPAALAIQRIDREVKGLALRAPAGEEVYLDVLDVRSDFEVLRVREVSDEEIAFDGLDARGQPAKAVQHYTRLSYYLRTETSPGARERIGFVFAEASEPGS